MIRLSSKGSADFSSGTDSVPVVKYEGSVKFDHALRKAQRNQVGIWWARQGLNL
jgi:hypothetical protein